MRNKIVLSTLTYSVLTAGCIIAIWQFYGFTFNGIDDANIYFVYMRNLASGHGMVFNAGGEKVEGFTSIAWTLIGSIFYLISANPQPLIFCFNFIVVSFTVGFFLAKTDLWMKVRSILSVHSAALLFVLIMIPGYFDWCVITMMDSGIWSAILLLVVINLVDYELNYAYRRTLNFRLASLLLIISLIRPEGMMIGLVAGGIRIWQGWGNSERILSGLPVLALLMSLALLVVFRLLYFGFPLPNTYYAKVDSSVVHNLIEGLKYLYRFARYFYNYWFLLYAAPVAGLIFSLFRKFNSRVLIVLSVFCTIFLMIPLQSGGDHFAMARFVQALIPVLLFQLYYLINEISGKNRIIRVSGISFVVVCLIISYILSPISFHKYGWNKNRYQKIEFEFGIALYGRDLARTIAWYFPEKYPSVGIHIVGGFAYHYPGFTNDLMGLNNTGMAHYRKRKVGFKNHASFESDVMLKQKPDLFVLSFENRKDTSGFVFEGHNSNLRFYKNITQDERFLRDYQPYWFKRIDRENFLHLWAHRDFVEELDTNVYDVTPVKISR